MTGSIKSHKDLVVWQRSFALVGTIYKMTATFPIQEQYGLTSQIRR
ncbi:MAG: four helix bundle protein, partial [Alphaproteobacteria bacterium]|nr:four helix bundle protein [Alphaproteobacteria bacterium]